MNNKNFNFNLTPGQVLDAMIANEEFESVNNQDLRLVVNVTNRLNQKLAEAADELLSESVAEAKGTARYGKHAKQSEVQA